MKKGIKTADLTSPEAWQADTNAIHQTCCMQSLSAFCRYSMRLRWLTGASAYTRRAARLSSKALAGCMLSMLADNNS